MDHTAFAWKPLDPARGHELPDVRLQFHYAAQLPTAIGISLLRPEADDSHTNLGWDPRAEALVSHEVAGASSPDDESGRVRRIRIGVRPADLTLLVLDDHSPHGQIALHGLSMEAAATWLRGELEDVGIEGRRLTLRRHYELPTHPVGSGAAFDATGRELLGQLSRWYANAASLLGQLRDRIGSSDVRCWPHHFDIATLATLGDGRSSGAGLSPGDTWYDEPYFYVNARPVPAPGTPLPPLAGGGHWHTDGWFGAVLPASRLGADPAAQAAAAAAFLDSGFVACRRLALAGPPG